MPHCGIFLFDFAPSPSPYRSYRGTLCRRQKLLRAYAKICACPQESLHKTFLRHTPTPLRRQPTRATSVSGICTLPAKNTKSRQKVGFFVGKITLLCTKCGKVSCALPLTTLSVCEHCLTVSKVLGRIASSPVKGGRGTRTKGTPYTLDEGQNCSARFCNYTCASFAQKILLPAVGQTYALFPPIPLPS